MIVFTPFLNASSETYRDFFSQAESG